MEDRQILELVRSNKHSSVFKALYNYFPVVKKMILSNGGRVEDAEDIYQEALVVFYKKAQTNDFQLSASINTYLYSISRYMWKDVQRKRKKLEFTDMKESHIPDEDFLKDLEAHQQYDIAEHVIASLGERCKELLVLFYFQSLKLKDIAKKMGYNSENTAKNQKYKCLESAKNKLKELQEQN